MFVQILQIIVIMSEMKTQECTSSAVYPMTQITWNLPKGENSRFWAQEK